MIHSNIKNQKGAALLIALVLLLVLTFMGVGSMETTTLEEKMASNQKDYYLAFEAAEFALKDAEEMINILFSTGGFSVSGANGLFRDHELTDKVWTTVDWTDDTAVHFVTVHPGMTGVPPKYIIERLAIVTDADDLNLGNEYGEQTGATETTIFRVTARGESGKGSVVTLQATVAKAI